MLGITANAQAKSTEKISSGFKINRAVDDAAGTKTGANGGMTLQIGANEGQTMNFAIGNMSAEALGVAGNKVNIASREAAEKATTVIDEAIKKVSAQRLIRIKEIIEHFSAHALRDTFATRYIEQGGSPQVLKTILGHSSLAMTMDLYSHVLPNIKVEEMKRIANLF